MIPIRIPPASPAAGTVITQPRKIQPNARQFTALSMIVSQDEKKAEIK